MTALAAATNGAEAALAAFVTATSVRRAGQTGLATGGVGRPGSTAGAV